jgi:hypothetical protein
MIPRRLLRVFFWLAILAAVVSPAHLFAELGLSVSLTTSGYSFPSADPAVNPAMARTRPHRSAAAVPSFQASAVIANLSHSEVPFSFPNPMAAARHWTFQVFDSTGAQVWISDTDEGATPVATPASLAPHSAWRRTVKVPLVVNGAALALGHYTLQATVEGNPVLGSTTGFAVISGVATGLMGIKGQVFQSRIAIDGVSRTGTVSPGAVTTTAVAPIGLGVKATVTVTQVLDSTGGGQTPFTWSGLTDDAGNFQVTTPVGKFMVGAVAYTDPGTVTPANSQTGAVVVDPLPGSLLVTVLPGKFTVHDIYLPGIIINPPPPVPTDTGVTGTVTQAASDANGSPAPLAGATVRLIPSFGGPIVGPIIANNASAALFIPWRIATGTTDQNGTFTLDDFAGSYRLTVYTDVVPGVYDPSTSMPVAYADVTVTPGQFTSVTLQAPSPVSPDAVLVSSITSLKILSTGTSVVGGTPQSSLIAKGTVPSNGWTQPALRPRPSSNPLVLEFDFVAVPPNGEPVAHVMTSIEASIPWPNPQVNVIRIYSATNSRELDFALPLATGANAR